MILELASLLGSSVGGKLFGLAGDYIAEKRHDKRETMEHEKQVTLANRNSLKEYYESQSMVTPEGKPSPLAYVIAFCIGLFAVTYCYSALSCFTDNPEGLILTKDPAENARNFSILFGFIEWDIANNKVISMSRAGLGYLMLHPIVFILSMVTTGDKPKRR